MIDLNSLSESEFKKMVDKEIRRDRSDLASEEKQQIDEIGEQLRDPSLIHRWRNALLSIKKSVETQLGARKSDLNRFIGTERYEEEWLKFHQWRAGSLRFLNGVEDRISEARNLCQHNLIEAIRSHETEVKRDYEATDADERLWGNLA